VCENFRYCTQMASAASNDILLCLGSKGREEKKGGAFAVYKINCNDTKQIQEELNNFIEKYKLYFIAVDSVGQQPLQFCQNIFNWDHELDKKYLIREKNTLRWANAKEEGKIEVEESQHSRLQSTPAVENIDAAAQALPSKPNDQIQSLKPVMDKLRLDSSSRTAESASHGYRLPDNIVTDLMERSYGRMAMANYRARERYCKLVEKYYEVFEFKRQDKKIVITLYVSGKSISKDYYYDVTLKDPKIDQPLKKLFEILQVYNSDACKIASLGPSDYIDGSVPLYVQLHIGGSDIKFMLSQYGVRKRRKYQVQVSMEKTPNSFVGNAYPFWIGNENYKGFRHKNKRKQQNIARNCLDCLDKLVSDQLEVFQKFQHQKIANIVEFLATTQIAESNHGKRDYTKSRTPGMNKLARSLLRLIEKEKLDFKQTFDWKYFDDDTYPAVGTGGTKRARKACCAIQRKGASCNDMSDDSDTDTDPEILP
jgi:hypothetical protein